MPTYQILGALLSHVISVLYRPLHLPWMAWLPTSSSHCSFSVGRLYSDNIHHEKSRCFLITTESSWTRSPRWGSYLAHRSLFSGSVGLSPNLNILQNKTFPKVSGIFPIFHDFSNSLPVALRLYLQFFFTLWTIICLGLEV